MNMCKAGAEAAYQVYLQTKTMEQLESEVVSRRQCALWRCASSPVQLTHGDRYRIAKDMLAARKAKGDR